MDRRGPSTALARRSVLLGATAVAGLSLLGCSASSTASETADEKPGVPAIGAEKAMVVFRDPSCGCCHTWTEIAREAGYDVELRDHPDMPGLKRRLGVPEQPASCHMVLEKSLSSAPEPSAPVLAFPSPNRRIQQECKAAIVPCSINLCGIPP